MVFLLFQDLDSARSMMKYLDPTLGRALPEKSYAENCEFTARNVFVCTIVFIIIISPLILRTLHVGRHRHILSCPRARVVWQSADPARLLVLLGKCSLPRAPFIPR